MRARLALLDGEARPNVVDLNPERPISIGRSRDNTVVLPHDEQASRLHARVYFENGRWLIRDFGMNGTRVDEVRINQVAELADGNEIRIGSVRFRFFVTDPVKSSASTRVTPTGERTATMDGSSLPLTSYRFGVEDLTALSQFMGSAVEARDPLDLGRMAVQTLFYQTGAAFAGLFSLDPSDPVPKTIWPEAGKVDEHLARQLTRRVQRDHRLVWMAEDTAATIPTTGVFNSNYADALALPLKAHGRVLAALHVYKASGFFSDKDRRFVEAVAGFTALVLGGLKARRALEAETARLQAHLTHGDELLGDSRVMVTLRAELGRAGGGHKPVLFRGEAGVGKEAAALEAHRRGPRADAPFVVVHCTTTPAALLEAELFGYRKGAFSGADRDHPGFASQADDGTLFLDEVADLPPHCQDKLLRLIQSRIYRPLGATYDSRADVKVMVGTRRELDAEERAGRIRPDLNAALRGHQVVVPPLRAHTEDIPCLAQTFLDRIGAECRREWVLTPDAVRMLRERSWPGNVRQLRSVLEHAAAATDAETITADDLRVLLGASAF
ncbi:MAG TPA: sigma 54-interacting transcriptional regulator [Gemmataceae bacterium]|nr:sigma 54-interacting transcriptional regulator [Gemmataceae bacterium]